MGALRQGPNVPNSPDFATVAAAPPTVHGSTIPVPFCAWDCNPAVPSAGVLCQGSITSDQLYVAPVRPKQQPCEQQEEQQQGQLVLGDSYSDEDSPSSMSSDGSERDGGGTPNAEQAAKGADGGTSTAHGRKRRGQAKHILQHASLGAWNLLSQALTLAAVGRKWQVLDAPTAQQVVVMHVQVPDSKAAVEAVSAVMMQYSQPQARVAVWTLCGPYEP